MKPRWMNSLFVLLGAACFGAGVALGRVIPEELLECYRDQGANPVPLSTASLVALVRKVERMENAATLDLRTLSYTLLHRFRADGLEHDPDAVLSELVVPVRQSGRQALKWDILAEQLLPGNSLLFPEDSLTHHEKCALHIMLSSSVDPSECFSKATNSSNMPIQMGCRERGAVLDGAGAVSAGTLLSALCAASKPQTVSLRELLAAAAEAGLAPVLAGGAAAAAPRDREKLQRFRAYSDMGSAAAVDSLWASTLAGDLSEVAIYQGPRVSPVRLGAPGVWDDPLLPRHYAIGHKVFVDLTDAELRGGIDGLLLGGGLRAWLDEMGRLRLSQLLEMYFSARGVVLDEGRLSACQRAKALATVGYGQKLRNETLNMARLLYMRSDGPQMSDAAIQAYSNASVSAFSSYYRELLSKDPPCTGEVWNPPYVHLFVVMDSTWTPKEAVRLLTYLAQQADVSELGSSLSLLDGRDGRWVINGSRRLTDAPQLLSNRTLLSWASGADVARSLQAVSDRLSELRGSPGGPAAVLLLLCYSCSLSDADLQAADQQLRALNNSYPELWVVAVTSDVNAGRLQALVGGAGAVLVAADSRAETVVPLVAEHLTTVPGRLVASSCGSAGESVSSDLELYLTPGVTTRMRIQPQYLSPGDAVTVQVQSAGYGVVRACLTSEGAQTPSSVSEGRAVAEGCAELAGGVVTLNATARGPPLLLSLTPTSSLHKCAEDDCRFPDQVRVTVRLAGLLCPGAVRLPSAAPGASLPDILTIALAALLSLLLTAGTPRT